MTYEECLALEPGDALEDTGLPGIPLVFQRVATIQDWLEVKDPRGVLHLYRFTRCADAVRNIGVLRPWRA